MAHNQIQEVLKWYSYGSASGVAGLAVAIRCGDDRQAKSLTFDRRHHACRMRRKK